MINRRNFIAGTSAALLATQALSSTALAQSLSGSTRDALVFDAMGEIRVNYSRALIEAIRDSGLNAITVTLTDPKVYEQQAYNEAKAAVAEYDRFLAEHPDLLVKATSAADIERARGQNRIAVFYLFQNSTQFGRDLSRVDEFYRLGTRSAQLTYNYQNWAGAGCKETRGSGVTRFGRELIGEMNRLGMLIDLSHANESTMLDAINVSSAPVVISHTACLAVYDNVRNTSDTALKALADRDGVVGICQIRPFITDAGPDAALPAYFEHIDHAVNVAGVEHVAIGSDRDHRVIEMSDAYLAELAREEGENFDLKKWPLYIDQLNGPRRMEVIWDGLRKRRYATADIDKIMGGNMQRLYQGVIG
ncbi:dipeptidase [Parahaliea mediterranea]|uniref:Membrane dipeptidase n=1 Tax=Parahaliea mediterranea TaxID=651086 RepID=A0A939IKH4_9GAMM|nr:membrane dipeptidase [Parahaliea mediterranea]MBN7798764.1 membrane dipeptidase [Parahaliea mediterranea]